MRIPNDPMSDRFWFLPPAKVRVEGEHTEFIKPQSLNVHEESLRFFMIKEVKNNIHIDRYIIETVVFPPLWNMSMSSDLDYARKSGLKYGMRKLLFFLNENPNIM